MEDSALRSFYKSVPSLVEICCKKVAESFSSYKFEEITGLTAPVLDILKFHLKPLTLHDMTDVLEQKDVDSSDVWKGHVMTALGNWQCKRATSVLEPVFPYADSRYRFIVHGNVCPFHQKYISLRCETLLVELFAAKDVESLPQIYKSLLHLLPSVLYLRISVKNFKRLTEWEDILTILLRNVETLILVELNLLDRFNVGTVAMLLKKFCGTKHLKGIWFESMSSQVPLGCFNELLRTLNDSIVMNSTKKPDLAESCVVDSSGNQKTGPVNENGKYETTENSLYDVAFSALDESKNDFWEILKKVHVYQFWDSSDEAMDSTEVNSLESLSIAFTNCLKLFTPEGCHKALSDSAANHFSLMKTHIRRLNLQNFESVASPDVIHEVLVMVGCHQLTHLRLADFETNNFVPKLLCILGECYSGKTAKPMELLHLSRIDDTENSKEKLPQFENTYEICAVKDVCFEIVDLGPAGAGSLRTFLRLNTCLQCLKLEFLKCTVRPSELSLVDILDSLMESRCLHTLFLQNSSSFGNGGETSSKYREEDLTTTVIKFLNNSPSLKVLKLSHCGITEGLVANGDFVEGIKKHPSLTAVSLKNNMLRRIIKSFQLAAEGLGSYPGLPFMRNSYSCLWSSELQITGSSGAQFLVNLLSTNRNIKLRELDISCCGIPGHALYSAAERLNKTTTVRPLINRLVISGMLLGCTGVGEEQLTINFKRVVATRKNQNREEHQRILSEFERLVDELVAEYYGLETADFVANM